MGADRRVAPAPDRETRSPPQGLLLLFLPAVALRELHRTEAAGGGAIVFELQARQ